MAAERGAQNEGVDAVVALVVKTVRALLSGDNVLQNGTASGRRCSKEVARKVHIHS